MPTLNRLIDLIIALAELFEAEGRELRRSLISMTGSIGGLLVAIWFALVGVSLLLLALWWALQASLSLPLATFITGVTALLIGGALCWHLNKKG